MTMMMISMMTMVTIAGETDGTGALQILRSQSLSTGSLRVVDIHVVAVSVIPRLSQVIGLQNFYFGSHAGFAVGTEKAVLVAQLRRRHA